MAVSEVAEPLPVRRPVDRRDPVSRGRLVQRVRAEFEEMPGLLLTIRQAERLFGLSEDVCQRVLTALVREGVLCETADRQFTPLSRF